MTRPPVGFREWKINFCQLLIGEGISIPSPPNLETQCPESVNDYWLCTLSNQGGNRLQAVINKILANFTGKNSHDSLPAAYWKWTCTEHQWLLELNHGYSLCDGAVIVYIHCIDWLYMSQCFQTLRGSWVTEISSYCPRGWGGIVLYIFAYTGCNMLLVGCLCSNATHITAAARPKIVDTPLMLILKMVVVVLS
jgi:hypothetical protein